MANCCEFQLKAVAKDEKTLWRLFDILEYKDPEWFISRVQYVETIADPYKEGDGLYAIELLGDVAWGTSRWFSAEPDPTQRAVNGATFTTLVEICKSLGIAVEIWAREPGLGYQSHSFCNPKGEWTEDSVDWNEELDEDGEVVRVDGGYDTFGQFLLAIELYNGIPEEVVPEQNQENEEKEEACT